MAGGPSDKVRVVIFGSGRGSNARALLDYALHHPASYEVVGILSDRCHAGVLDIAREYGIAGASIIPNEYSTVEEYIRALLGLLEQKKIEVIVLAGYLRRVPSEIVAAYAGRILNIHPALLPNLVAKGCMVCMCIEPSWLLVSGVVERPFISLPKSMMPVRFLSKYESLCSPTIHQKC